MASKSFHLLTDRDLEQLGPPTWLIEGCLPEGGLSVLFGQPGVGKSFVALDWALSIGELAAWHGRSLTQGLVIYVAAEGRAGLFNRVQGWKLAHGVERLANVRFLPVPVQLLDPKEVNALLAVIQEEIQKAGARPVLVVIDTLARCFVGGDENQVEDMGRAIAECDRIRAELGTAVLLVHHAPKANKKNRTPRGSSALEGAADTIIQAVSAGHGLLNLKCDKQKDAEPFEEMTFLLRSVPLGGGVSTCVVEATEWKGNHRRSQERALDALVTLGAATSAEWQAACGLKERTYFDAKKKLLEARRVIEEPKGIFRPAPTASAVQEDCNAVEPSQDCMQHTPL